MSSEGGCCPNGSWPALKSDYVPCGEMQTLENKMQCYVTGKADSDKAVLVIFDVFGVDSGRIKAICDQLGSEGWLVVMPDFFHGDPLVSLDDIATWAVKYPYSGVAEDLKSVAPLLAGKQVATWGFCWGCWAAHHAAGNPDTPFSIVAGVNCHPSLKLEPWLFGGTEKAMAEACNSPQLLLSAANDPPNVHPDGEVITILKGKFGNKCEAHSYPRMQHGWVNRGDLSDDAVKEDVRSAIERGVAYLKTFFN